jgi:hypothetical protein
MTAQKKARRARKSYEARTGMNTRAAVILAKALVVKPATVEDDNGNVMRVWLPSEANSYTNQMLADCLRNRVAVEPNEMLGTVPPSAIKYCVTKGWLIPNENKTLYRVTAKAALELVLPRTFKGGVHHGRKIPFTV